jgi:hypothetical protein
MAEGKGRERGQEKKFTVKRGEKKHGLKTERETREEGPTRERQR